MHFHQLSFVQFQKSSSMRDVYSIYHSTLNNFKKSTIWGQAKSFPQHFLKLFLHSEVQTDHL